MVFLLMRGMCGVDEVESSEMMEVYHGMESWGPVVEKTRLWGLLLCRYNHCTPMEPSKLYEGTFFVVGSAQLLVLVLVWRGRRKWW
jgi:hypothetical protein